MSKLDEAEPFHPSSSGVTGSYSCFGRVACRCLPSSPPSFFGSCFQPLFSPLPVFLVSGSSVRQVPTWRHGNQRVEASSCWESIA